LVLYAGMGSSWNWHRVHVKLSSLQYFDLRGLHISQPEVVDNEQSSARYGSWLFAGCYRHHRGLG